LKKRGFKSYARSAMTEKQETNEPLDPVDRENGEHLAALIQARANAEHELFTFFEELPEEDRPAVYQHAMSILAAQQEYVHLSPGTVQ
jgi:hypothetical protein